MDFALRLCLLLMLESMYTHRFSPTRLPKQELTKENTSRHENMGGRFKPYRKSSRQLSNAESSRNSLFSEKYWDSLSDLHTHFLCWSSSFCSSVAPFPHSAAFLSSYSSHISAFMPYVIVLLLLFPAGL